MDRAQGGRAAVHSLLLPLPDLLQKGLTAQLVPVQSLLLPELLLHHHLGGNACVVTARVPQGGLPTHAMPVGGECAGKAWCLRKKGLLGRKLVDSRKEITVRWDPNSKITVWEGRSARRVQAIWQKKRRLLSN